VTKQPLANTTAGDILTSLRRHTPARIGLGRTGVSVPLKATLEFAWAQALARDAVFEELNVNALTEAVGRLGLPCMTLNSRAADRHTYLLRPDLGRRLDPRSAQQAAAHAQTCSRADVVFVISDGLSSRAVQEQALPVLEAFRRLIHIGQSAKSPWLIGPVVLARQARVALGDEIGELLGARMVVVMIGERPGLSSPHSMSLYLTYQPRIGTLDSSRNCISNIQVHGMDSNEAAHRAYWLTTQALQRGLTGVGLKDDSGPALSEPRTLPINERFDP
jgi:ethanolamine ammonia-lyase small subunit